MSGYLFLGEWDPNGVVRPNPLISQQPARKQTDTKIVRKAGVFVKRKNPQPAALRRGESRRARDFRLTPAKQPIYDPVVPRKVILGFGISLDGYIARRNGDLDFLVIDKEGEAVMADFFSRIDTTIMGRKTAAITEKMRERGEIPEMPGMTTYVISRRWKPGKRERFEVVGEPLKAFVKKLKRRPGKDIYLGGGGELARSFLQEDLVDEIFIGVSPMLLGDGIPAFPGKFPQRDYKLTECKSYSNGSIGLRYERLRTKDEKLSSSVS